MLADRPAEIEPVGVRQLQVEHRQAHVAALELEEAVDPLRRPDDAKPVALQVGADEGGDRLLVLDQQDRSAQRRLPATEDDDPRDAVRGETDGDAETRPKQPAGDRDGAAPDSRRPAEWQRDLAARAPLQDEIALSERHDDSALRGRKRPEGAEPRRTPDTVVHDLGGEARPDRGESRPHPVQDHASQRVHCEREVGAVERAQEQPARLDRLHDAPVDGPIAGLGLRGGGYRQGGCEDDKRGHEPQAHGGNRDVPTLVRRGADVSRV